MADRGPSYLGLLGRGGCIGELLNWGVRLWGGFRLGRRFLLWGHSAIVVQRVVRVDSSSISEDCGN